MRPAETIKEGRGVRAGRREAVGDSGAGRSQGKGLKNGDSGQATRAKRTRNMLPMVVTLDVSRLSGWLNADAPCRDERGAYNAG